MRTLFFALLAFVEFQTGSTTVVEPAYPVNAFQGGTVVAELALSGGNVSRVKILRGDEPFVGPTVAALRQWRFSKEQEDRPALVVVNFRGPNLHSVGAPVQDAQVKQVPRTLPRPKSLAEPSYPPNSQGQGGVVLHLKIASSGSISETRALKGLGDLTQACGDAVRLWKFEPAKDLSGTNTASEAYAVCVFRQPVLGAPK